MNNQLKYGILIVAVWSFVLFGFLAFTRGENCYTKEGHPSSIFPNSYTEDERICEPSYKPITGQKNVDAIVFAMLASVITATVFYNFFFKQDKNN